MIPEPDANDSVYPDTPMTVAEAAEPDETVEDRLRAAGDCEALLACLRGAISAENMTYEDWVHPLKVTGGKVCLRVEGHDHESDWFFRRRSDGLEIRNRHGHGWSGPPAVRSLRDDMATNHRVITPVRVEDTPFGGEDE